LTLAMTDIMFSLVRSSATVETRGVVSRKC
jgi:hypothetical protein